jgi:tetratricopeptide (TPR) repeat protein
MNISFSINKLFRCLLLTLLYIVICDGIMQAQLVNDTSIVSILNQAYSKLRDQLPEAVSLFEKAASMDPNNVSIHNQLGYIYLSQNKVEESQNHFIMADSLKPSDTTKLQIAYNLIALNQEEKANKILEGLLSSSSPYIQESAESQLKMSPTSPMFSKWWTRIYLSPYYDTRWKTVFYYLDAERGYYFDRNKMFFSYGFLLISADGKSNFGEVPEIFSDNAIVSGIGLGVKPFNGLEIRGQAGVAYDMVPDSSGAARIHPDFRALAIYGNGIYPNFEFHDNLKVTLEPLLDIYSSVGYYSRYKNVIGYLQGRAGMRVFEMSYTAADLYIRSMYVKDSEREFYNNLIDIGAGLRILPFYKWDLYVMAEYYRGLYIDGLPSHYDTSLGQKVNNEKYFGGFRLFIIYDHIF